MIKVAFFAEILIQDFDGAARTMFQIIDRLDNNQYEYMFVYGKGPEQFRDFRSFKMHTLQLPVNDDYSLALPALTKQKLYDSLDIFDPDVIHISTPSPLGFFALKYASKRNIPIISIYHTNFLSYIPYYFKNFSYLIKPVEKWMAQSMRKFYNQCSKIYIPTKSMINDLTELGIRTDTMTLWQRGIDLNLFTPNKRNVNMLREITHNDKPNILFVSRLVWEKNIRTLIEIYQLIENKNLNYNLIVVGDGNAKAEASQRMPNAFFLGKQDHTELSAIYASADVFIFTSISETYGNVVIEAMASGVPCVIANGGGSADLIEHGITGYKCRPTYAEEYIAYIQLLLEQPTLHHNLQHRALHAVQDLNWDNLTHRYFEDIKTLAALKTKTWAWAAG